MNVKKLRRDALLFVVLVVVHEVLARSLADGQIVSALFSPGGAHSAWVLATGALLLVLRVALLVGVPGWLGSQMAILLFTQVRRLRERPRSVTSETFS